MRKGLVIILCLAASSHIMAAGSIADSVHNLSTSGKGPIKSKTEDRICIFCHTPHTAVSDAPMWNRRSSGYTNYESSTTDAVASKKQGPSGLCLSCHDGTIALGDMVYGQKKQRGPKNDLRDTFLKGRSNLGTDLSDDHPIGIVYDTSLMIKDGGLNDPSGVELPLVDGEIQCASCHDPHSDKIPPFLHKTTLNGELCTSCHQYSGMNWDWENSAHASSTTEPKSGNPWPERKAQWRGRNVGENSCMNCHASHNAATPARLVADVEEKTCYRCHDGTVSRKNIRADKQKFFRHPVDRPSRGDLTAHKMENPLNTPLHVECEDCHNPHASRSSPPMIAFNPNSPLETDHASPPYVNGSLVGVSGIDVNGRFKEEADYEYEVCFKCHGIPAKSACANRRCSTATNYNMSRLDDTYNLRDKFDPGNPTLRSYHPVVRNDPNNNSEVPSLRKDTPLDRTTSLIYCGDCHSSDVSPAAGGVGPAGVHGSRYEGILALRYEFDPQSNFNTLSDNLCLKCHDAASLFGNESFLHREHVVENNTSCINCHDPHGSASYPHLINFLTSSNVSGNLVRISGAGPYFEPTWISNGQYSGTCYLSCHGTVHDGATYPDGLMTGPDTDPAVNPGMTN